MRRRITGMAVLLAVVAASAVLVSPRTVFGRVESLAADPLAFGVVLVVLYLVRPLLAWPTLLCSVAVGYGYGVAGFPIALVGAVVTALPPYGVTRWAVGEPGGGYGTTGDGPTRDGMGGRLAEWILATGSRVREAGRRYFDAAGGFRGTVAARVSPVPADVVTCAAAASGVPLRPFALGTLVGEAPWVLAAVVIGASTGRIVGDPGAIGPELLLAGAVAAGLLLAGPAYRRFRNPA